MKSYKNILLINFGGIGDEMFFLPTIASMRRTFPNSKITLCLEKRSGAFLSLINILDNYFFININEKTKYLELLKLYFKALTGGYDLVLSTGSNPLIPVLLFFTGIKTRVGYDSNKISSKLLTNPVKLDKNKYTGEIYYDLAKTITNEEFKLPHLDVEEYEKMPNSVLVHPGVSQMSVEKGLVKIFSGKVWAKIIKELLKVGKNVYLAGGPDDSKCIEEIRSELKDTDLTNYKDLYGTTKNLRDLMVLIKKSEVLLCSDSAPMHISTAIGNKTVGIFGPTDDFKLLPKGPNFYAVKNNADCRPCLWDKRKTTCEELKCLDIDINQIVQTVLNA